jgi:hypothetical protein
MAPSQASQGRVGFYVLLGILAIGLAVGIVVVVKRA